MLTTPARRAVIPAAMHKMDGRTKREDVESHQEQLESPQAVVVETERNQYRLKGREPLTQSTHYRKTRDVL